MNINDKLDQLLSHASKAEAQHAALSRKVDDCVVALRAFDERVRVLEQSKAYIYGIAAGLAVIGSLVVYKVSALLSN